MVSVINIVCVLLAAAAAAAVDYDNSINEKYDYTWHGDLKLVMSDGIVLHGDACVPKRQENSNVTFPLIILSNSWACPTWEYVAKLLEWSVDGYVLLEFENRGWYFSGGEIDMAGPRDQLDVSEVITWALSHNDWHIDDSKIATVGISYGAGLALLSAAKDDRITTAVSMSGWGSIEDTLRENQSPSLVWSELLMLLGKMFGREPPILTDMLHNLLSNTNITEVLKWADLRSPSALLKLLNARKVPVLMSNNLQDRLFKPESSLKFFQALEGPKIMLLNQGIHATAEIGGLVDLPHNFVWSKTKLWLDHFLKGKNVHFLDEPTFQFQLRNNKEVHVEFVKWPGASLHCFVFVSRSSNTFGRLVSDRFLSKNGTNDYDVISFSPFSGLTAGIPVVGPIFQDYVDIPITSKLQMASRSHALVFLTEPMVELTRLCGTPNVTLNVTPSATSFQFLVYLYDVDQSNIGSLLSEGPATRYDATPNVPISIDMSLRTLCYDVPPGHSIGIGINMFSLLYEPANTNSELKIHFNYGGARKSALYLPIVSS